MLFQRFFRVDQGIGGRQKVEEERSRRTQVEPDGHVIHLLDRVHKGEVGFQGADNTFGRVKDAVEGRHHVLCGKGFAVVVGNTFTQRKGVGKAALAYLPALGQIGDDCPQSVNQVVANQVVVHVGQNMGATALVRVKVGHRDTESRPQRAAAYRVASRSHHAGPGNSLGRRYGGRRGSGSGHLSGRPSRARGQRRCGSACSHHLQKSPAANIASFAVRRRGRVQLTCHCFGSCFRGDLADVPNQVCHPSRVLHSDCATVWACSNCQ